MAGSLLFLGMAMLALAAGLLVRSRLRRRGRKRGLTDEMVRRIEREGELRYDGQRRLDLEAIREEEEAFWEQTWDEPQEL